LRRPFSSGDHRAIAKRSDPAALIERVRTVAMGLPGVTEKVPHGEPAVADLVRQAHGVTR
jgi:hypothetical protein